MPDKAVYLLVVDGFADWEPAHAVAELRRTGQYLVRSVGLARDPVESMGGIRVLPSMTVADVDPTDVAVFILPGGDRWESSAVEPELAQLLKRLDALGVPLAAICGATVAISRLGLLRGRRHTSNGLEYLQSRHGEYAAAGDYVDAPAVRDRGLITASGLGDVEFARELFEELNVLSAADRAAWATMFRSARLGERTREIRHEDIMKDAPFNTGFLAGALVMIGAQAVGWFIQSPGAVDAGALRTAAVIVQAVIGFGGATWLYARERGRATRTS